MIFTLYHCAFVHRGCTCCIEVLHLLIKADTSLIPPEFEAKSGYMFVCCVCFNPKSLYLSLYSILDAVTCVHTAAVCVNSKYRRCFCCYVLAAEWTHTHWHVCEGNEVYEWNNLVSLVQYKYNFNYKPCDTCVVS